MRLKAYITPKLIKWARETAKFSLQEAAKKIGCETEKLISWEAGEEFPTLNQAEKLSHIYRRPLAAFYLPEPPKDFDTLRDFRKENIQQEYSTALTFMLREIQAKQTWMREFLIEQGEEELSFIGKYSNIHNVKEVAEDIIKELNIDSSPKEKDLLKLWVDKIESKRIFVSLTSYIHSRMTIDINEVRGFAISDKMAPFIFVNTADTKTGQLFTLIHELCHLWINSTGVSNINVLDFREPSSKYDPIELFCNEVTAQILMPEDTLKDLVKEYSQIDLSAIDWLAKTLNVSPLAISVRLLNLNLITKNIFFNTKKILDERYQTYLDKEAAKESSGGPNWYVLQVRRNSKAFSHFVYDFFKGGRITGYEASSLLNVKLNNFGKLENFLVA